MFGDHGNGNNFRRPLGKKQTVRLMLGLTFLAWATQTLLHQWGYGQVLPPMDAAVATDVKAPRAIEQGEEHFMPSDRVGGSLISATIEMRGEATVVGGDVKLRQVCRWSDADAAQLGPMADLVLIRFSPQTPFRSISMEQVKQTLRDAGINLAALNFVGSRACTINRSDAPYDEQNALEQWATARSGKEAMGASAGTATSAAADLSQASLAAASSPGAPGTAAAASPDPSVLVNAKPFRTLRDVLTADLATRLNVPLESLQMTYRSADDRLLNLAEPQFTFDVEAMRAKSLGDVSWNVKIRTGNDDPNKRAPRTTIAAEAKMWQQQLVVSKPLTFKQSIRDGDVVERRALVDRLPDDPLIGMSQAVGQQAARELKPGMVMTGRMVDPVQLCRGGQLISVIVNNGAFQLRTSARAMESGAYGQAIRCRNESTNDTFEVTLTGPQEGTMTVGAAGAVGTTSVAARDGK